MSLTNNPKLVPLASLRMAHLVRIIYQRGMTDIPITGRLSQLLKQCKKVTWDKVILSIVKGYHTPFISFPVQEKPPNLIKMSDYEILLAEKGAIHKTETALEEFL